MQKYEKLEKIGEGKQASILFRLPITSGFSFGIPVLRAEPSACDVWMCGVCVFFDNWS